MTEQEKNDYFYVCSLIEYIARQTKNRRRVITEALGKKGVEKLLYDAGVNHCLSFEQVSDEVIEQYHIPPGDFDTITECKYAIPGFLDIGKLYSILIEDCAAPILFYESRRGSSRSYTLPSAESNKNEMTSR